MLKNDISAEDKFDVELYTINEALNYIEKLYDDNFINLKQYFEIKGNIIQKLLSISKDEVENIKEVI